MWWEVTYIEKKRKFLNFVIDYKVHLLSKIKKYKVFCTDDSKQNSFIIKLILWLNTKTVKNKM